MGILSLVLVLTVPWILVHFTLYLLKRRKEGKGSGILPLTTSRERDGKWSGALTLKERRGGEWELGLIWCKYSTRRWNAAFSRLSVILNQGNSSSLYKRGMEGFYAFGAGVCVLALIGGWIWLLWQSVLAVWDVFGWKSGGYSVPLEHSKEGTRWVKDVMKRSLPSPDQAPPSIDQSGLHTLIPGVTLPLSHLPVLLLVLSISGVIHELGHALTASLYRLPIHLVGLHLFGIIPTFFVAIPEENIESKRLEKSRKLKVVSAGAWHNIVLWAVLALLGVGGKSEGPDVDGLCRPSTCSQTPTVPSSLWGYLGYTVATNGLVVTRIDDVSPLFGHLDTGDILKSIDDIALSLSSEFEEDDLGVRGGVDRWELYLRGEVDKKEMGWCVPSQWFEGQSNACCSSNSTQHGTETCFSTAPTEDGRCVDPVPLYTYQHRLSLNPKTPNPLFFSHSKDSNDLSGSAYGTRCHATCIIPDGDPLDYSCIRPISFEHDHRIWRLEVGGSGDVRASRVLVFRGPASEIYDHLKVGYLLPPFYLPFTLAISVYEFGSGLWESGGLFWVYLASVNLSLAGFNLLPVHGLDGGVILGLLLHWVLAPHLRPAHGTENVELHNLESGMGDARMTDRGNIRRRRARTDVAEHLIGTITLGMVVVVSLAAVWRDLG